MSARLSIKSYACVSLLCVMLHYAASAPSVPPAVSDNTPEVIEIIAPARNTRETLDSLNLGDPGSEIGDRNKRTIGILRQMFPEIAKGVDEKVTLLTSLIFQAFGPAIINGILKSGGTSLLGGGDGNSDAGKIDEDDVDDDDIDKEITTSAATAIKLTDDNFGELKTEEKLAEIKSNISKRYADDDFVVRRKREASAVAVNGDENQLLINGAESQQAEVRVEAPANENGNDQNTAESTNNQQLDELTLEDVENSDENRNKRFLNFGLGSSGGGGGSSGGSGNFIFDIVRLVAGSSASEPAEDGTASASDDGSAAKGDGLTEGVPGPITRLFIIANRGIANLIQDLILRLAQTSERIVNFKARLITSII